MQNKEIISPAVRRRLYNLIGEEPFVNCDGLDRKVVAEGPNTKQRLETSV